jgi:hypothetical protein
MATQRLKLQDNRLKFSQPYLASTGLVRASYKVINLITCGDRDPHGGRSDCVKDEKKSSNHCRESSSPV